VRTAVRKIKEKAMLGKVISFARLPATRASRSGIICFGFALPRVICFNLDYIASYNRANSYDWWTWAPQQLKSVFLNPRVTIMACNPPEALGSAYTYSTCRLVDTEAVAFSVLECPNSLLRNGAIDTGRCAMDELSLRVTGLFPRANQEAEIWPEFRQPYAGGAHPLKDAIFLYNWKNISTPSWMPLVSLQRATVQRAAIEPFIALALSALPELYLKRRAESAYPAKEVQTEASRQAYKQRIQMHSLRIEAL
jgi:hypothetical protein